MCLGCATLSGRTKQTRLGWSQSNPITYCCQFKHNVLLFTWANLKLQQIIYIIINSKTVIIKHLRGGEDSFWIVFRINFDKKKRKWKGKKPCRVNLTACPVDKQPCLRWGTYAETHDRLMFGHQKRTHARSADQPAETSHVFICTEGDAKLTGREGRSRFSLSLVEGWLLAWLFGRREHASVAPGDKQTFIPAVSCLLDLRGATDSSWIHLALVKHVQS